METIKTNIVSLSGTITKAPTLSHEILNGEKFYEFMLDIQRLSGAIDTIPVTISERLIQSSKLSFNVGENLLINGEFRSHNQEDNGKSHLILSVLCKEVAPSSGLDENRIELSGFVCKPPIYRETPFKRQINDILLAVNRPFNKKSDYIPLIVWGRNALMAKNMRVGDQITISGRIQSRKFTKMDGDIALEKTAYEVSVQEILNYEENPSSHVSYDEQAKSETFERA